MKKTSSAAGAKRTARTAEAFFMSLKTKLPKGRSSVQPRFKLPKKDLRLQNIGGFSINGKGRAK
ncbi:MAG: hypothetical protein B7Y39_08190 [Bdellovibrio sp. 28-41-41]|nr:MAG: hypothetical protein B7Y39_08190 [Bdellovibrio sp. 28-41-41]